MQDVVWICTYCSNQQTEGRFDINLFKRYVDDIICTVRGDPDEHLKFANLSHNLQFILEVNMEADLAFLDINVKVSSKSNITCHWYQKPADTGILLNFRSCAPLKHKKICFKGRLTGFSMHYLIGWPSIRLLERTKLAGPKVSIQRNGLQKK